MAKFLDGLRALFVESSETPDDEGLKDVSRYGSGWKSFTYPRCRKCGRPATLEIKDDSSFAVGTYRIILECVPCEIREIIA